MRKNDYLLTASEVEAASFFLDLAGAIETYEDGFERLIDWIEKHAIKLERED